MTISVSNSKPSERSSSLNAGCSWPIVSSLVLMLYRKYVLASCLLLLLLIKTAEDNNILYYLNGLCFFVRWWFGVYVSLIPISSRIDENLYFYLVTINIIIIDCSGRMAHKLLLGGCGVQRERMAGLGDLTQRADLSARGLI